MIKDIWKKAILPFNSQVKDAIRSLELSGTKIVLIVNAKGKFIGTITHKGRTQVTKKGFKSCLDAQKYTASEMFLMLKDLHDK